MKRLFFPVLFLLLSLVFSVSACAQEVDPDTLLDFGPSEPLTFVSQSGSHTFQVEVADTLPEQRQGYMYREDIPDGTGLLFEYDQTAILGIYMKNTPLPLDIIFVRPNGRILKIAHSAQPYKLRTISSEAPVNGVVELLGGTARDLGIMPGDIVEHPFFGTADAADATDDD